MVKDLKDHIKEIESYCANHNLKTYPTSSLDIELVDLTPLEFNGEDWFRFLDLIRALDAKMVVLSTETNELDLEDKMNTYKAGLEGDQLKEFSQALRVVQSRKGELVHFQLNFFQGNINYQFRKEASWINSYDLVKKALEMEPEDTNSVTQLKETEVEDWARKLVLDPKYRSAKDRFDRERIANNSTVIKGIGEYRNRFLVIRRAEEIFEQEIQPGIDEEYSQKIKAMKKAGLKKIEVKSRLKIGDAVLNKFWYDEN